MNKLYFYIVLQCLCLTSLGQYSFSGAIRDEVTNSPIVGADIYCHNSEQVLQSDLNGAFSFEGLTAGMVTFTIFTLEYSTLIDSVLITQNSTKDFRLKPLDIKLSEVEIIAKKKELFALKTLKDVEGTSINAGRKSEVIVMDFIQGNTASNNARQIYAQVAGLNIYEGSNGGLQLGIGGRGLDPNRTSNFNTRQNGYDISADVLGYPENYYTPPADAIEEIQVIRGASALQYGTQFGGLINFKLRKARSFQPIVVKSLQTVGSFGLFNSFNYIGGNKGKWSANAFYNYKQGDGYRSNSTFRAHTGFLNIRYQFSKSTSLSAEATYFNYLAKQAGGLTDRQFRENPRQSTRDRNWFGVDWLLYNLKLEHNFDQNKILSVSFFGLNAQRNSVGFRGDPKNINANPITDLDEQDIDGNYILSRDLIKGTFDNLGIEAKFLQKYKWRDFNNVLLVGAKIYKANNTSMQGPGSKGVDADFNLYTDPDYANQSNFTLPNTNVALFGEHIFYLSDRLSITPGVRLEYIKTESKGRYNQVVFDNAGNPIANNTVFEVTSLPRRFALFGLGVGYEWDKSLKSYANLSQNYRSVTFSDIRVVNPTFIIDSSISDERGFTADVGLRGQLSKLISYDVSLYSIAYRDRIGVVLNEKANRVRKNIGNAIIGGVESLVDFNLAHLFQPEKRVWQWNIFANTALTTSQYTSSDEQNVIGKRVEFIPFVNLKSGVNFGYKNILANFQITYLSEQFTDVQNSEATADGDSRSGVVGKIDAYEIMDCSVSYSYKGFGIEAGINNVLDKSYFTRRATGYPGPGIIPSDGRSFYLTAKYNLEGGQ